MNKELLRKENFPVFGVYPDLVYLDSSGRSGITAKKTPIRCGGFTI